MKDANPLESTRNREAKSASPPKREYRTYLFQIGLLAAIGAFATLTFIVQTIPSLPIDVQITRGLQSIASPLFASLMVLVSWPGYLPQSLLIVTLIAVAFYASAFYWESVACLFAALFVGVANVLVKEYIGRPRPTIDIVDVFHILDSYSFPSGHVMLYVTFFGFVWFLVYTLLMHSWMRTTLLILLGSLIALVGVSRIYLGQHWASDVLGAYLLGSLTLVIVLRFYRWGGKRFFVHRPAAPKNSDAANPG